MRDYHRSILSTIAFLMLDLDASIKWLKFRFSCFIHGKDFEVERKKELERIKKELKELDDFDELRREINRVRR